jgi:hypothetical protein
VKAVKLHERFFYTFNFFLELGEVALTIQMVAFLRFATLSAYEHMLEAHASEHHYFLEIALFPVGQIAISLIAPFRCQASILDFF